MAKAKVVLKDGSAEVHPAKLKKAPPLDRTPRCELCVHYYRHDLKKKRRGVPQSCHDLNCEPHDHCKLFQRLPEGVTQPHVLTVQRLTSDGLAMLDALLLDRRKQIVQALARSIRTLVREEPHKVWVTWRDAEGQLHSARVLTIKKRSKRGKRVLARVSSSVIYLRPVEGRDVPEKIRALSVVEVLSDKEYTARKEQRVNEREPPTTRRPPKDKPKK